MRELYILYVCIFELWLQLAYKYKFILQIKYNINSRTSNNYYLYFDTTFVLTCAIVW